jgi:single-strand DNA-binding protein
VLWGKQAEIVGEHSGKGDLVYVAGRLQTSSWEDKDGQKRYRAEVVAEQQVRFLTRAAQRSEPAQAESGVEAEHP